MFQRDCVQIPYAHSNTLTANTGQFKQESCNYKLDKTLEILQRTRHRNFEPLQMKLCLIKIQIYYEGFHHKKNPEHSLAQDSERPCLLLNESPHVCSICMCLVEKQNQSRSEVTKHVGGEHVNDVTS